MTLNRIKQGLHLLPFIGICVAFAHSSVQAQPNTPDSFRLELQLGHTKTITHLDFSNDSSQLVSSSQDESIKVWDIKTGRLLKTLPGHQAHVQAVEYSHDDSAFVSVSLEPETRDGTVIKRWDPLKGKLIQAAKWRKQRGNRLDIWDFAWTSKKGVILTAGAANEVSLWDTITGEKLAQFRHQDTQSSARDTEIAKQIIVLDPHYAVSGHSQGALVLWDLKQQKEISRTTNLHKDGVTALTKFKNKEGRFISMAGNGQILHWNLNNSTLQQVGQLPTAKNRTTSTVAGTGDTYYTGHADGSVHSRIFGRAQSRKLPSDNKSAVVELAISNNGHLLAAAFSDSAIAVWNLKSGSLVQTIEGRLTDVWSLAVDPNQTSMAIGTGDASIHVWNLETGAVSKTLNAHTKPVGVLTFSPDGKHILSAGAGGKTAPALAEPDIRLWETDNWELVHTFNQAFPVGAAFSDGGHKIVAGGSHMGETTFTLWGTKSGEVLHSYKMCQASSDLSRVCDLDGFVVGHEDERLLTKRPDASIRAWSLRDGSLSYHKDNAAKPNPHLKKMGGKWNATLKLLSGAKLASRDRRHRVWGGGMAAHSGSEVLAMGRQDKTVKLYNWNNGEPIQSLRGHQGWVRSTSFSSNGEKLVSAAEDKTAIVWDIRQRKPLTQLKGHMGAVWDAGFSASANFVWTSSADGTVRLWNTATGELLATLVAGTNGDWAITTPEGHFDANDLETIEMIHWVKNQQVAPLESFMRDYYEPKLLNKLLANETLRPVKDINQINIDSPTVTISNVTPGSQSKMRVDVTLDLTSPKGNCLLDDSTKAPNGVFDVRLFRNRQMVAYKNGRIKGNKVVFKGVQLPMNGSEEVTFSAYAFNCDRVKSLTTFKSYQFEKVKNNKPARTYIISVGVNAFDSSDWNLRYAVNDAKLFQEILPDSIANSRSNNVVSLGLYAELKKKKTTILPTKENLKVIFDILGGRPQTKRTRKLYPWAKRLKAARPSDRVIVTFATHGFRTKDGGFYLFPSDTGRSSSSDGLPALNRLVSATELQTWFRDIDAGEFLMVIDACNSAASVQQADFRPGPMGSRGLGQLAYNKGMRIIAASQGNMPAKEDAGLQHGLLTYALVREGIQAQWADQEPKDGIVTLGELLTYASARVPRLDNEARRGRIKRLPAGASNNRGLSLMVNRPKKKKPQPTQQPQIFDFVRNQLDWRFKPVK